MSGYVAELVLIRGLPGSGKSTLAKSMAPHYEHIEADMYFVQPYVGYVFDRNKLTEAHAWCQHSARIMLSHGKNVVVSNTFTQKWEMHIYLEMAQKIGAKVRIIEANGDFENIHGVPVEAIERMRARWESI